MQYGNNALELSPASRLSDLYLVPLIDPGVRCLLPVAEIFLSEPESNLVVGGINRVGAVADVPPDLSSEKDGNNFLTNHISH